MSGELALALNFGVLLLFEPERVIDHVKFGTIGHLSIATLKLHVDRQDMPSFLSRGDYVLKFSLRND
jgi:hypothetical protein